MAFHQSWGAEGIDPPVKGRDAGGAQRTGTPGDRMNAAAHPRELSPREARDIAEIHQRLDSIARQVEQLSQHPAARSGNGGVARQLNDAISRLDMRLSQMPAPAEQPSYAAAPRMTPPVAPPMSPPLVASPLMASPLAPPVPPPTRPAGLDLSIAEIIARQGELDSVSPAQETLNRSAPNFVHAPPLAPDHPGLANIERQIASLTSQIETLRRPDAVEQSVATFRSELAEIRHAITEALPRRAIESLEGEIRTLGRRIDETHQTGGDGAALGAIERALSEIRSELRSLTPAEQLAGFDDAIRNLNGKIDTIIRSSQDPGTLRQLDDAISALKTIVANIASNETLTQLSENIRTLSQRVDQLSQSDHGDMFAALEQRIAALTATLEQRERPPADSSHFDNAVRTISDRLDNLQIGGDAASTFNHVEQRVAHLLERLETSEARPSDLSRVESGLSEIMRMLQQRGTSDASPAAASAMDPALVDAIRRELSDMRQNQVDTTRHTQDSLEVVHNTLGHVVDRLAQIEGDLRARPAPAPVPPPVQQRPAAPPIPPQMRPELPNPALLQSAMHPAANAHAKDAGAPQLAKEPAPVANAAPQRAARSPIDPDLPPDHPLEPGSRSNARPSAAERIASSENALRDIAQPKGPVSSSNFIQAARRAAQAAQAAEAAPKKSSSKKASRVTALNDTARPVAGTQDMSTGTSRSSKVRALLVGASVFVIVLGTFKMASNLWNSGETDRSAPAMESRTATPPPAPTPPAKAPEADDSSAPALEQPAPQEPSMTSPTPIDRQSMNAPVVPAITNWASAPVAPLPPPAPSANADITGSIPPAAAPLPESIGGQMLRAAALKGDASAAYEIAGRYAEGRGVTANAEEAAKWYARAAKADLVPAMFRLGTLYEKGLGVRKDIDAANRYYRQAADRGNAKAMHNLAVLEADGGGKPNYKAAIYWFQRAAQHGVADSQFNLGILYARGIGIEQNLVESYKWFSLAAAQGDTDAANKRDDVAKRLDPASLAKAKLAAQTFKAEQQPAEAFQVATPPGGWDAKRGQKTSSKSGKTHPAAAKHSTI